ncbi:MAG: hypothetical protein FWD03_01095 [Defluviitaleaceae bacterium]|nr:hypothetical protein [Defluviitaleaceae bacterium]
MMVSELFKRGDQTDMITKNILLTAVCMTLLLIIFTSCTSPDNPTAAISEPTPPVQPYTSINPQGNTGVSLEAAHISLQSLTLILTNHTAYEISYDDGYTLSLMLDGQPTHFGSGAMGFSRFTLPPGEQAEIHFDGEHHLWPGEFRMTRNVTIDGQQHEMYVDFAIPDDGILASVLGFQVEVSMADPMGVVLVLTNGFENDSVYFDRYYRLQQNIDGSWQDVPELTTRLFPEDAHFIAPRQIRRVVKNWGWLHGELEPGEYRIMKSFQHHNASHDLPIEFIVDGTPEPHPYIWGYNPFEGAATFRGEVLESGDYDLRARGEAFLVRQLTPMWEDDLGVDGRSFIEQNEYIAVLDANSEPILFSDVIPGDIVDITFSGIVLQTDPSIIGGGILVRVVE